MSKERTPREDRDKSKRVTQWTPPSVLPTPDPQDGYVFRWIRTSMVGVSDNRNVSMRFREGWEPVKVEDHPELMALADPRSEWGQKGAVEVGGLMLCKCAKEIMDQRAEYYQKMADEQLTTVDNNLMRESDDRMPILAPERSTRVQFGSG